MTPAESFAGFAEAVHARVPDDHSIDLRDAQDTFRRATCGDCGRVVPTRQNLCPRCGGSVHDVVEIDRMREVALHFDLKSQPFDAVKAAAAEFMKEVAGKTDS